jgi:hypothetical protein
MKEKILRAFIFFGTAALLIASVGIISWINQNEGTRLTLVERFNLEKKSQSQTEALSAILTTEKIMTETDRAFSDIGTLLLSIGSDDLPDEE